MANSDGCAWTVFTVLTAFVSESDSDTVRRRGGCHVMHVKITAGAVKLRLDRNSQQRPPPPCPSLSILTAPTPTSPPAILSAFITPSNSPTPPDNLCFNSIGLPLSSLPSSLFLQTLFSALRRCHLLPVLFHFTFFLPNRHFSLPTNPQPISPNLFTLGCHHLCLSSFCLNLFGPISLFV